MAAIPPINKASIIGIWIETVLYGVNCVLYGLCMFVLLRGGKTAPLRRMLLVMSTILFLLGTVHVGASLRELLEAFIYAPANVPYYSTTYWLNLAATPRVLKGILFSTLVLAQDFILIWRLYVVFLCNWKVVILPIILAAGCVGSAYAATAEATVPNNGLDSTLLTSLVISAWVFGFSLNASVTGSISSSIYMVVESGAISAVTNAVMLAMFASKSYAALFVMDISAQVTVLTPLLIVVQVAYLSRDRIETGNLSTKAPKAPGTIAFRLGIPLASRSGQDSLLDAVQSQWTSSAHDV